MTNSEKIRTAVVTGRHPYDVPNFYAIFKNMQKIDFYPQHMEDFISDSVNTRDQYDVIVFYNFHQETPGNEQNWWDKGMKDALEHLGEKKQGILLLHHAILAFPKWDVWANICGIQDRKFSFYIGEKVKTQIAKSNHPITNGLSDWEMVDETYLMNDAQEGCEILLTTDNSRSMKTLAWTRQYKNSKVFCYQCGHDNLAYSDPNFRKVLENGIIWLAE
jgi:trehalose utilization protein